jgi:ATP-dependent DNA ligase
MRKIPVTVKAMAARSVDAIPDGGKWQPKWDGFRCLLARDGHAVRMYSKSGQDLSRYRMCSRMLRTNCAAVAICKCEIFHFIYKASPTAMRADIAMFKLPLPMRLG